MPRWSCCLSHQSPKPECHRTRLHYTAAIRLSNGSTSLPGKRPRHPPAAEISSNRKTSSPWVEHFIMASCCCLRRACRSSHRLPPHLISGHQFKDTASCFRVRVWGRDPDLLRNAGQAGLQRGSIRMGDCLQWAPLKDLPASQGICDVPVHSYHLSSIAIFCWNAGRADTQQGQTTRVGMGDSLHSSDCKRNRLMGVVPKHGRCGVVPRHHHREARGLPCLLGGGQPGDQLAHHLVHHLEVHHL